MPFLATFLPGYGAVTVTSLDVTNDVTMGDSGRVLLADGTAALPSLALKNSPTTGQYRGAADVLATAAAGVLRASVDASRMSVVGAVRTSTQFEMPVNAGAPTVVAYDEAGTDTGIGVTASNVLALYAGGGVQADVRSGQFRVSANVESSLRGRLENTLERRASVRTADIVAVGTTVAVAGQEVVEFDLSAGSIVSTAAPFMADGAAMDRIRLRNIHATNTLTLATDGAPATNLRLRAATRVLSGGGGYIDLEFSATLGLWCEVGFA